MSQDDIEALRSSVALASVGEAASLCGVAPAKIEACAAKIASGKKVVAVYDLDDTLERATDDLKALAQILILTGHLGKEGEGLLLLQADCNSEGARIAGITGPLHLDRIRGALVMFENPFGDYRAAKELRNIESMVVIDHFLTETARMADVVLPAATLAESDGTVISFDGKLGNVTKASGPAARRSTAEVIAGLAQALGRPVRSADPVYIRAEFAASLGIPAASLEEARNTSSCLPRRPAAATALAAVRLDSAASVANVFPYASLDAVLDKKLEEMSLVR